MSSLVFLADYTSAPFTTSDLVAKYAEVSHHAIQQLISVHENDLKDFGKLAFEMRPSNNSRTGQLEKIYRLNEQQATLLITYLRNTEPVRLFKKALVKEFFHMHSEIINQRLTYSATKPARKTLAEAVSEIPPHEHSRLDFAKFNNLAYLLCFGCSASKLKRDRGGAESKRKALDFLSAVEIERLTDVENKIAVLISCGLGYTQIKEILSKNKKVHSAESLATITESTLL